MTSTDDQLPDDSGLDDLSFDTAEVTAETAQPECVFCGAELRSLYFEVNCAPTCEKCRYEVEEFQRGGSKVGRLVKAGVAGFGAALVGAGIYYAVLALTGYEVGLIAIVVGFLVGGAVRWGAQRRGGWLYQTMAVVLTYVAIVGTYVPFVLQGFDEMATEETVAEQEAAAEGDAAFDEVVAIPLEDRESEPVGDGETTVASPAPSESSSEIAIEDLSVAEWLLGLVALVGIVLALPFLAGFENIIGLVIIGFALWQAWSMNRRLELEIAGPFEVGRARAVAPPPANEPQSPFGA